MTTQSHELYRPKTAFDVLRLPLIGRLLKWRWGRLILQIPLLLAAALLVYDGFTGTQRAPENLATIAPWVHYRGLVMVALLLVGNLFCMGCPFTITRTLAKRSSIRGHRFPRALRNKWLAIATLFVFFFLYEWLDLWSSPLLTAWVIVFYFALSFVLEAAFTEFGVLQVRLPDGDFQLRLLDRLAAANRRARHGNLPSLRRQRVRDRQLPRDAADRRRPDRHQRRAARRPTPTDRKGTLGCGTELFAPFVKSNMDCMMCLDCARACPHDNVGLMARTSRRGTGAPRRLPARAGIWRS